MFESDVRLSGNRRIDVIAAVWVAHASRVLAIAFRNRGLGLSRFRRQKNFGDGKRVAARRRNQHARRMRYPELAYSPRRPFFECL